MRVGGWGDKIGFKRLAETRLGRVARMSLRHQPASGTCSCSLPVGLLDSLGLLAGWAANRNCTARRVMPRRGHTRCSCQRPAEVGDSVGTSQDWREAWVGKMAATVMLKLKSNGARPARGIRHTWAHESNFPWSNCLIINISPIPFTTIFFFV